MSVMMEMFWEGIKPEQYEQLRSTVNWEGNFPKGAIFHVSAFEDRGIHVIDLWDSAEEFNDFVQKRLMPEVQKLGVTNEPKVNIYPVHAIFAPRYKSASA
jgi:hypothetical protein